jgi:flagellar assembly protein FliH
MSEFVAGFSPRSQGIADALKAAFAPRVAGGFAAADLRERAGGGTGPVVFAPKPEGPRHFSPADRDTNPTEGWDPFDAEAPVTTPFVDPVIEAHAAGYAEGMDAALAEVAANVERDHRLLTELAAALQAGERFDREATARRLRQTVMFLVTQIVGEVGIAPELLARRIDSAAELLSDGAESAMLRVNPADVALLEGKLPKQVFAVGDAAVTRGSFVLESASTIVEDGPELWIEQLGAAIDRVAVPMH